MSSSEWFRYLGQIQTPEVLDQKVQSLQDELSKHEGQFVLVVCRKWEQIGWDMPEWRTTPYHLEEKFHLGSIRPPFLELRSHPGSAIDFSISLDKHVAVSERSGRDRVELVAGPIEESIWKLDMPVGERPGDKRWASFLDKEEELALEIVVGDEAVKDWFLNQAQYERMSTQLRQFTEDPKTPSEKVSRVKEKYFDADVLILFQRMQSLLGRKITSLSPEIQARVEAKVLKQKEQVLASLETLIRQEVELIENLARIQGIKLPRIVVDPLGDNQYEREVQQDEKDLRMIKSIPVNEEYQRVQDQIKAELEKALKLGMHQDPWVIVREPKPGHRIEINVPKVIRGYCEYCEIPIPQGKDSSGHVQQK